MKNPKKRARIDKGSVRLNERDFALIRFTGDQYKLSLNHFQVLAARLGGWSVSVTRTYQMVKRLVEEAGELEYSNPLRGKPGLLNITRKGLHDMGLPYSYVDASISNYNHLYACTFIRLWLENWAKEAKWQSFTYRTERILRWETKSLSGRRA